MKYIKTILITVTAIFVCNSSCAQDTSMEWSEDEKEMYQNLKNLAFYVHKKSMDEISKDTLFHRFIEMEYVLLDTLEARKLERLEKFEGLFSVLKKRIDSLGVENLDAKPLRYYRDNEIYKPFLKNLKGVTPHVMVYYKKSDPENPLGALLFEQKSKKLLAWVLLLSDKGSNGFFLTLNLF